MFDVPGAGSHPLGIVAGPDGRLWFTQRDSDQIGAITAFGAITEFEIPGVNDAPTGITSAAGFLFFAETGSDEIARMTTAGAAVEFAVPGAGSEPTGITFNPTDGLIYFTQRGSDEVARIGTAGGAVLETALPAGSLPTGIAPGSDGAVWFAEEGRDRVGRIKSAGTITDEFPVPGAPHQIASGPGADAPLWFTMPSRDAIGRITTSGVRASFALRSLTVSYAKRRRFKGRLTSSEPRCIRNQHVTVFRKRRGKERRVGTARTNAAGKYKVAKRNAKGRFYARVKRSPVGSVGVCVAFISKAIKA